MLPGDEYYAKIEDMFERSAAIEILSNVNSKAERGELPRGKDDTIVVNSPQLSDIAIKFIKKHLRPHCSKVELDYNPTTKKITASVHYKRTRTKKAA